MTGLEPGVQLTDDTIAAMERLSTSPSKPAMTKQHKATPEQWTVTEKTSGACLSACILELRARVKLLEAAQQRPPHQDKLDRLMALDADEVAPIVVPSVKVSFPAPAGSLVERVATAIYDAPNTYEGWRSEARAAILEVAAAALQMHPDKNLTWERVALWLEQEAKR